VVAAGGTTYERREPTYGEQLPMIKGVELCAETFGDQGDPAIPLVAGSAASMTSCADGSQAADRYVIRCDHRDAGR